MGASQRAPLTANGCGAIIRRDRAKRRAKLKCQRVQPVGHVRGSGYQEGQETFRSQQQQRSAIKKAYGKVLSKAPPVKAEGQINGGFLSS